MENMRRNLVIVNRTNNQIVETVEASDDSYLEEFKKKMEDIKKDNPDWDLMDHTNQEITELIYEVIEEMDGQVNALEESEEFYM